MYFGDYIIELQIGYIGLKDRIKIYIQQQLEIDGNTNINNRFLQKET